MSTTTSGVAFTPSLTRRKAEVVVAVAAMTAMGMPVTGASLIEQIGGDRTRAAMSSMLKSMVIDGWLVVKGAAGRSTEYGIEPDAEIVTGRDNGDCVVTVRFGNGVIVTGRFTPKKENNGAS